MNKNLINKKGQEENMNEKFLRLHEVKRRTGIYSLSWGNEG